MIPKTIYVSIIIFLTLLLMLSLTSRVYAASPSPTSSPSPSPNPIPASIELTEIMACPATGESEWVELHNTTNQTVNLTNWKVRDNADNSKTISLEIPPGEYKIAEWSGSLLNNAGDELHLETNQAEVLISVDLPACTKGSSLVFFDGQWVETTTPTPGEENLLQAPEETETPSATSSATSTSVTAGSTPKTTPSASDRSAQLSDTSPTYLSPPPTPTPSPINYQIPNYKIANIEQTNPFLGQQVDFQSTIPSKTGFVSLAVGGLLLTGIGVVGFYKLVIKSGVLDENN